MPTTETYPTLLLLFARVSPTHFVCGLRAPRSVAFGTWSSGAIPPVTLRAVDERLGVNGSDGSFTLPLGATINMDGEAIMQEVAMVSCVVARGEGELDLEVDRAP